MLLDPVVIRKINLLTSKQRPFCAFCKCLVGFTWQRYDPNENLAKSGEVELNHEKDESQPVTSAYGYDLCMTCFA